MAITYSTTSVQVSAIDYLGSTVANGTFQVQSTSIFEQAVTFYATSNQLVFQPSGPFTLTTAPTTITLTCTNPAASRVYTIVDAGANANFVMTQGAQTIVGATTFSTQAIFSAGHTSATAILCTAVSNQVVLGGASHLVTISSTAIAAAAQTLTIYDALTSVPISGVQAGTTVNFALGVDQICPVTVATTLGIAQSGCLIPFTSAAANYVINLPAVSVAAGIKYKILNSVTAGTNTVTVQTGNTSENKLQGLVVGGVTQVTCVGKHNIVFGTGSQVGDYVELECDGVNWAVRAWAQTGGSLTVA